MNNQRYAEIRPPPIIANSFEGWTTYQHQNNKGIMPEQEDFKEADDRSFSSRSSSIDSSPSIDHNRRRSSIQIGNQVSELLDQENVKHAVEVLQEALEYLNMAQEKIDQDDGSQITGIYSKIIKSLCDPNISKIVDEFTPKEEGNSNIYNSVLWRLFTKVVETGHTLQTDAHLSVVSALVDKGYVSLALQAMYTLRRKAWDTKCYRTAVLLHLMQDPKQIMEAQKLLLEYGKPYLDIANPTAPNDLPPLRIKMPLMESVTETDQFRLWMFYQAAQSKYNTHWAREKEVYETKRKYSLDVLTQPEYNSPFDWAFAQLNIETEKFMMDRQSTENDNTMIYVAMMNQQYEYGWQVYKAMEDAVNESTPCVVMQLCWVAFNQIPIVDVSYRTDWETRAWSVYSRFMCSEYLHPEQPEAPSFIHDILCIAAHTPEVATDKKARYTKTMSVYQLLVRLNFDKLLCDNRVLEPLLCTFLLECKGTPTHIVDICKEAFEIRKRKRAFQHEIHPKVPFSLIWGYLILCLKAGDEIHLPSVLMDIMEYLNANIKVPSTLLAPVQKFHDKYICQQNTCYFDQYMFKHIEYTENLEDRDTPEDMNEYGILCLPSPLIHHTNIQEPEEPTIAEAVMMGPGRDEIISDRQMYHSSNKAKALIRHVCNTLTDRQASLQAFFPT